MSRFRNGGINLSTKIDLELREKAQAAGKFADPYHGEESPEPGAGPGAMDLKNQEGAPPAPVATGARPITEAGTGRGAKSQGSQVNSSQPGAKSGSGK